VAAREEQIQTSTGQFMCFQA